jgi:hypothetical protein
MIRRGAMARTKKVTQTQRGQVTGQDAQNPTPGFEAQVPVKELARRVLIVNKEIRQAGVQTPVPCLIGPTRSGKTERALQLAEELGLKVITLLPGTEYPEEILGYLRPVRCESGLVVKPLLREELARCVESPHLFLIDELDKAQKETVSALLTLLAHRKVRNVQFHPQTEIICAMQPVSVETFLGTETGRALAGRLLFLPVSRREAYAYIQAKTGLDFSFLCQEQNFQLPILPDTPPSLVLWAAHFVPVYLARWGEEGLRQILYGAFQPAAAEGIIEVILRDFIDPFDLAREGGKLKEWVDNAELGEVITHLPDILSTDWRAGLKGIKRVVLEADVETSTAALHAAFSKLHDLMVANGGVYEFDPEVSEEEGAKLFSETLREIAQELAKRVDAQVK